MKKYCQFHSKWDHSKKKKKIHLVVLKKTLTSDLHYKFTWKLFTEVINPVRSWVIFS